MPLQPVDWEGLNCPPRIRNPPVVQHIRAVTDRNPRPLGRGGCQKAFEPPLLNLNVEEKEFACKIKEIWNRPYTKKILMKSICGEKKRC